MSRFIFGNEDNGLKVGYRQNSTGRPYQTILLNENSQYSDYVMGSEAEDLWFNS
jgi:hypothetical protein